MRVSYKSVNAQLLCFTVKVDHLLVNRAPLLGRFRRIERSDEKAGLGRSKEVMLCRCRSKFAWRRFSGLCPYRSDSWQHADVSVCDEEMHRKQLISIAGVA